MEWWRKKLPATPEPATVSNAHLGHWMFAYHELCALVTSPEAHLTPGKVKMLLKKASLSLMQAFRIRAGTA
jgi:hypothetical protein